MMFSHTLRYDLSGPMITESINGKKYVLVIVEDFHRLDAYHQSSTIERRCRKDETRTLMELLGNYAHLCESSTVLWDEAVATAVYTPQRSLCLDPVLSYYDYDTFGKLKAKADIGIFVGYAPTKKATRTYCFTSGRSRSTLVKDPEPPSVPPTKKQVDDLFQWFDDDEVVPIPPVVPITPVNVPAAPAPENANGSPSTTVISEGAPAVTESLLPHQVPLPDTSDSDIETLFDHVDSNVFDTYNAPETDSEASSSNSVIQFNSNRPITSCAEMDSSTSA
ncbi:hypothetical protein Tco_0156345 [Tanacetum coccineum]